MDEAILWNIDFLVCVFSGSVARGSEAAENFSAGRTDHRLMFRYSSVKTI